MCGWVSVVHQGAFNVVVLMRVSVLDVHYHMVMLIVYTKPRWSLFRIMITSHFGAILGFAMLCFESACFTIWHFLG